MVQFLQKVHEKFNPKFTSCLIRFITGRARETKFSTVPRGSPSPPDMKNSYSKQSVTFLGKQTNSQHELTVYWSDNKDRARLNIYIPDI